MRMLPVLLTALLAGCGVSETATVAATAGAAKGKEVEQTTNAPARVQGNLDDAAKWRSRSAKRLKAAEGLS